MNHTQRRVHDDWLYPERNSHDKPIRVWHIVVASVIACGIWWGIIAVAAYAVWKVI